MPTMMSTLRAVVVASSVLYVQGAKVANNAAAVKEAVTDGSRVATEEGARLMRSEQTVGEEKPIIKDKKLSEEKGRAKAARKVGTQVKDDKPQSLEEIKEAAHQRILDLQKEADAKKKKIDEHLRLQVEHDKEEEKKHVHSYLEKERAAHKREVDAERHEKHKAYMQMKRDHHEEAVRARLASSTPELDQEKLHEAIIKFKKIENEAGITLSDEEIDNLKKNKPLMQELMDKFAKGNTLSHQDMKRMQEKLKVHAAQPQLHKAASHGDAGKMHHKSGKASAMQMSEDGGAQQSASTSEA